MKRNELYRLQSKVVRILQVQDNKVLVIDCNKMTMPEWKSENIYKDFSIMDEKEFLNQHESINENIDNIDSERRKIMYKRYTMIAGILPFIGDIKRRALLINTASVENSVSTQSIRKFLCQYLVFQEIQVLLPKKRNFDRQLSQDEKNIRWSLNKFFYNHEKNSLKTAYTMMLKEKYCDDEGQLMNEYPSFYQYRYFYRKTRKLQNFYITRNGLTNYQRNNRPCTGDRVQEYAPAPGVGMIDSTVCDIYLVNDIGQVVGRPILTACVDAYSGLCCGYSLSWEGGVYSIRDMALNIITDKVEYCRVLGIEIADNEWSVNEMPMKLVSDKGAEYIGHTFEQLSELGVTIVNLPAYRPELKGSVEKFFDIIQSQYKKYLKGKGVIEPDFQERGVHDYRRDASLTMDMFSQVIARCIVYYNSHHVIENYPYTEDMIEAEVRPYANCIWNWGRKEYGNNTIPMTKEQLILCLLPRTIGKFNRFGLIVNRMRYHNPAFTESYLSGGEVTVAYDPDSVSYVWILENGRYTRFELVESRYSEKDLIAVQSLQEKKNKIIKSELHNSLQADIELANHIQVIADKADKFNDSEIKKIRAVRKKEQSRRHISHVKEAGLNGE